MARGFGVAIDPGIGASGGGGDAEADVGASPRGLVGRYGHVDHVDHVDGLIGPAVAGAVHDPPGVTMDRGGSTRVARTNAR